MARPPPKMEERRVRTDGDTAGVQVALLRQDFGRQAGCHMLLNDLSDRLRDLRPLLIGKSVGIERFFPIWQIHASPSLTKNRHQFGARRRSIFADLAKSGIAVFGNAFCPFVGCKGASARVSPAGSGLVKTQQALPAFIHPCRRLWQGEPFTPRHDNKPADVRSTSDMLHLLAVAHHAQQIQCNKSRGCSQEDRVSGHDLSSWKMERSRQNRQLNTSAAEKPCAS
jgi:hypothetical protein